MTKQGTVGRAWYAVHTYSGYENAVLRNLKQRIESLGMQNKIFNVVIPTEKKIKVTGGKRATVEEKIYPGYILVDMIVDDESWYVVRNTPRVTGFLGEDKHTAKPMPITEKEAERVIHKAEQRAALAVDRALARAKGRAVAG